MGACTALGIPGRSGTHRPQGLACWIGVCRVGVQLPRQLKLPGSHRGRGVGGRRAALLDAEPAHDHSPSFWRLRVPAAGCCAFCRYGPSSVLPSPHTPRPSASCFPKEEQATHAFPALQQQHKSTDAEVAPGPKSKRGCSSKCCPSSANGHHCAVVCRLHDANCRQPTTKGL